MIFLANELTMNLCNYTGAKVHCQLTNRITR